MIASMEVLVENRRACSISDHNPYFFSRPGADTHIRGSDSLRQVAKECGAVHPEMLSSTKLRKQIATMSTVLNMKENEMDILANFLGHDIRIHRQYYRLPEGTLELAKISKVLMAMEQGRVTEFEGKSLDQIQIEPEGRAVEILSQTDGLKETSSGEPSTIHPDAPHGSGSAPSGKCTRTCKKAMVCI
uniref:Uncharacterized protein n=1 Tax=Knipowitschia caucasica TaxID=637954 RepID=A0AAV2KZD5_KNICA